MNSEFLTVKVTAEILGVTPGTLANWRWLGQGPKWIKLSGRVSYPATDLAAYICNAPTGGRQAPLECEAVS